jgi:hypothetical protein
MEKYHEREDPEFIPHASVGSLRPNWPEGLMILNEMRNFLTQVSDRVLAETYVWI